jgi:hypothetical protein
MSGRPVMGVPWSEENANYFEDIDEGTSLLLTINTGIFRQVAEAFFQTQRLIVAHRAFLIFARLSYLLRFEAIALAGVRRWLCARAWMVTLAHNAY